MAGLVYILCAATCLLCATMLFRGFARHRKKLLLWSSLCFFGLMIENAMLYLDVVIIPEVDLSLWRKLPALTALTILLFGLIWDPK